MNSLCPKSNALRFKWYTSGKETDLARLRIHIRTCAACKERSRQLTEQARSAIMPPLEDEDEMVAA